MPVAYDASVSAIDFGVTTMTTGSFTIAGTSRAAQACLGAVSDPGAITAISVAGQAGSAVSGAAGSDGTWFLSIYKVIAPASGSQTASASWTTARTARLVVITASGVEQATAVNGGNYAENGAGNTVGLSITSASGDLTASFSGNDVTNMAGASDRTMRITGTEINADTGPGAGTVTHNWTHTGAFACNVVGANFIQLPTQVPAYNSSVPIGQLLHEGGIPASALRDVRSWL